MRTTLRRAVLVACLAVGCSSCMTMGLWGYQLQNVRDASTGEEYLAYRPDPFHKAGFGRNLLRFLATPLTLGLDVLTLPFQPDTGPQDDDDDDDDDGCVLFSLVGGLVGACLHTGSGSGQSGGHRQHRTKHRGC